MAKLPRVTQKIFAQNSGTNDVTVFGTAKNGNDAVFTKDINQIMNSDAFSQGWGSATLTDDAPFQEDMNGVQLALSQQLAYFFENGMPEWDENTIYYANTSFCQVNGVWYQSLTDNNIGNNPTNDNINWYKIDLDKLNPDLSNLTSVGIDKINQSKALETGSVSSDADVYADIQKYAHSTFDLSKFEVVGSPVITDDGIASGFSADNIIKIPDKYFSSNLSALDISLLINTQDLNTANQAIFGCKQKENTSRAMLDVRINNSGGQFVYSTDLGTQKVATFTAQWLGQGKDKINFKINNSKIELFINEELILTVNDFVYVQPIDFYIGSNRNKADIFQGSIDLESIAIWADGVPVFNGNKTGLYIAKPDNYEVVGSPTITEDGVAGGFSLSNYINTTSIDTSKPFKINFRYKRNSYKANSYTRIIRFLESAETCIINIETITENSYKMRFLYQTSAGTVSTNYLTEQLNYGEYYDFGFEWTGTNYIATYKKANDKTYKTVYNVANSNPLTNSGIIQIGNSFYSADEYVDLNYVKFDANGNLNYQSCLKIPYTEASSGSKIVDVAYRDRVQDLYEQTGEALFYTIDEQNQNFTLPMGDIYGMIERKNNELNNPFSLFDYKYADAPIYNMSWLQANGSWYAKSVYISAYEALVVENNSDITAGTTTTLPSGGSYTKRGLSVKLSTDSYTDTDFVINTTDETFRLPLKAALTPVTGGSIPVIGNGMAMGLINGYNSGTFTLQSNTDGAEINVNGAGQTLPYNAGGINRPQNAYVVGLSKDPAISGVIADISASTGLYLYYYVGETTQSPYIINNSQKLNNDASNLTEPGKTNIKNLVYPDFNNTVSLDTTLNLVQQADKDCYLHVSAESGSDLWVDICNADGVTKLTLIASDTAADVATVQTSPLIPAGTYFKVSRNVGSNNSLTKIYTTGESNV